MENLPNVDPNNLVVFYVVATEKSLTSAAEKLFLTQPAVTYRIKSLEEYTRVKLIDIKKHRVTLTPSGEQVFKYAREIFQQLVSADRFIKSIRETNLPVGIASIYNAIVRPVLNSIFEEQNSDVKLTIESGNAFSIVQNVLDSRLDLAIVPRFDYAGEKLRSIEVSKPMKLVCFSRKDLEIDKPVLDWKDVNELPLVGGPQSSVVRRMLNDKFKSEGIEMRPLAAEVDNVEWCITLVEHGKGISFAFINDIEQQIKAGHLKVVNLKENLYLSADAIMPQNLFLNPIVNRFITMVKKAFKDVSEG